jgi:Mn2+/Fe2+ NRAMP family transporter
MVVMMLMAARSTVMGQFVISFKLKVLGWLCTVVMAIAVAAMFWSLGQ